MKPVQPDDTLAKIVGSKPLSRSEVTKKVWDYIKKNKLREATDGEIEPVVTAIIRSVDASEKTRHILSPLAQKLRLVGQTATLNQKFEQLSRNEQGVALVRSEMEKIVNDLASRLSAPVGPLPFRVKRPKNGTNDWIMIYGPRRDDAMPLVLRFELIRIAARQYRCIGQRSHARQGHSCRAVAVLSPCRRKVPARFLLHIRDPAGSLV
jgi:SWIB/MDM2 domain